MMSPLPKRLLLGVGIAGAVLTALAVPWAVGDSLKERVTADLSSALGLSVSSTGRVSFALLPTPRLKLNRVEVASPSGEAIGRATYLRGDLRLLPLLAGRIDVSGVYIYEPRLTARSEGAQGEALRAAWQRLTALDGDPARLSPLERIALVGGAAAVINPQGQTGIGLLRNINLVFAPATRTSGARLAGTFVWRNETLTVSADGPAPSRLGDARGAPLSLNLSGRLGRVDFVGAAFGGWSDPKARLTGDLMAETPSLRDLMDVLRLRAPFASVVGRFGIEGNVSLSARGLDLDKAQVRLNGDALEGALAARMENGRLAISATLDAPSLDLTPLLVHSVAWRGPDGGWNGDAIDWRDLDAADLDLRLSATAARIGRMRLSEAALGVMLQNGRMELHLGRASFYRGVVRGRLSLARQADGRFDGKAQASADRIDSAAFLTDLGRPRSLSGQANIQIALDSVGQSVAELVKGATGKAGLILRQGEIQGLSLADALRSAERRPLSVIADLRGGRTPYEQIALNLAVRDGSAEIGSGTLAAGPVKGVVNGRLGLADLSMAVRCVLTGPALPGREAPSLSVTLSGPWDNPVLMPDVRALIQRSVPASSLIAAPPVLTHPALDTNNAVSVRSLD